MGLYDGLPFAQEWEHATHAVRETCVAVLAEIGVSQPTLDYVSRLKGVAKFPYLATIWVKDEKLRTHIARYLGVHCIGIKLVDDLLDQDQPYPAWDLGMGVYLMQLATGELGQLHHPAKMLHWQQRDFLTFWKMQFKEKSHPPHDLESWLEVATIKCGLFIADYAALACTAGDALHAVDEARKFCAHLATLVMVADDLEDHRKHDETTGNLGYMITQGVLTSATVADLVNDLRSGALAALAVHPTAYDMRCVVDAYANDTLERCLAPYVTTEPGATAREA